MHFFSVCLCAVAACADEHVPTCHRRCGHINIDPSKGKAPVQGMVAAQEVMLGATFKPPVPENFTDFRKPHTRQVPAPQPDMARAVMTGTAPGEMRFLSMATDAR